MREAFDLTIHDISADFLRMQSLTLEQLTKVRSALQGGTVSNLRERIRSIDLEVDQLEIDLEAHCLRAIARHQPVASDLRFFMLILKSLTDLERIGDYAVHIAGDIEELAGELRGAQTADILPLLTRLTEMLEKLSYAFTEKDVAEAAAIERMDDDVDALYEQLQRAALTRILEDPRSLSSALKLNRMARSLERLGDHIENVAERIRYWLTGQR
ncbi:phosphate transport system protein [Deinobacterium chartae]|uniref:Phosphate-specific transport system accessory protein PhoU n=1 Tax=Deinobacterium chartae TaxID=521158 RepID=A0A841I2K4_9DEIO|nr:phosphate signaling complex protein PhoU [Deinobacterium chartae]MBB6099234.1 phosphate transport system protein [Deinobacterium chartae]